MRSNPPSEPDPDLSWAVVEPGVKPILLETLPMPQAPGGADDSDELDREREAEQAKVLVKAEEPGPHGILRDGKGRIMKGSKSLNPKGPPPRAEPGFYTKLMQEKRAIGSGSAAREVTLREALDLIVMNKAMAGHAGARRLWRDIQQRDALLREEYAQYLTEQHEEKELHAFSKAQEDFRRSQRQGDFFLRAVELAFGNMLDLKEKLEAMGAVEWRDGLFHVAPWLVRPISK